MMIFGQTSLVYFLQAPRTYKIQTSISRTTFPCTHSRQTNPPLGFLGGFSTRNKVFVWLASRYLRLYGTSQPLFNIYTITSTASSQDVANTMINSVQCHVRYSVISTHNIFHKKHHIIQIDIRQPCLLYTSDAADE